MTGGKCTTATLHFIRASAFRYSYLAQLMIFKRILRAILTGLLAISVALLFFVGPVDRSPVEEYSFYQEMMQSLDSVEEDVAFSEPVRGFSVGYARVNLTPPMPTSTAGYGNRRGKLFTGVRDSLYVRAMVIGNGTKIVALVSADLLIIPPEVTLRLNEKLRGTGFHLGNTYLGATHTHNSIGNWGKGATRFIYGKYEEWVVNFILDRILQSIQEASREMRPSQIYGGLIAVPEAVKNRFIRDGREDPWLRVMEVRREDNKRLALMSFTAHATCLFSKDLDLSRDYPGKLVDTLEAQGYAFAMFMAGGVANHGFGAPNAGDECIDWMAAEISNEFLSNRDRLEPVADSTLTMLRVPLPLSDPQVRISEDLRVRPWLFRAAVGEYPVFLTGLRVGDIVFLGTPADFSGLFNASLDSVAFHKGVLPIVTSFNGGYVGYLTPRQFYDHDHYETRFMNWYAPGTGEYITRSLSKIIGVLDDRE